MEGICGERRGGSTGDGMFLTYICSALEAATHNSGGGARSRAHVAVSTRASSP